MRFAIVLLALLLLACGEGAVPWDRYRPPCADGSFVRAVSRDGDTTVVSYLDGTEARVPADPRRVVSTLPGLTKTMIELDLADRLVAITEHCEAPLGREEPVRLSVMPLDRETLATLDADLILMDGVVTSPDLARLGPRDPPVLRLESRSVRHVQRSIELLAQVFPGEEVDARRKEWNGLLARAWEEVPAPADPPLRVLLVAETDPLYVLGPGSLLDDMFRACGCVNVAADLGRPSGPFSEELVLERRPDWVVSLTGEHPVQVVKRWSMLPGATVHVFNASMWAQAAPSTSMVRLLDLAKSIREELEERGR